MFRPLLFAALAMPALGLSAPVSEGEKLFALKIKPLFAQKCNACHGDAPGKLEGRFDMRTRESMLRGGETFAGRVLVPGNGDESLLYIVTTRTEADFEMPPKEADQLTQEQRWSIRDWIDAGAPWPDDGRAAMIAESFAPGVRVPTSQALTDEWKNRRYDPGQLWAYQPIKAEIPPPGEHPIDHFIARKLDGLGLAPAPPATARELARRLSFGLTGLPPQPDRVARFVDEFAAGPDAATRAFAAELMASPQYGEHFGRQWLDVARYADSAGFANDYPRPNAWRYRDYVVRAFNEDKPYDQFVREQLAGDELDPDNPEFLVAAGFLRMGPWEQTGMSVFRLTRQQWLDDVTDSVGQTFLVHALQCAKCHDHKFDPVPTRDYYSMMAVFSTTQFSERPAEFIGRENTSGFAAADQWVRAKLSHYQSQEDELEALIQRQRKTESGEAQTGDNGLAPGDEASLARMNKNIERHRWELDKIQPLAFSVYTGKTVARNAIKGPTALPADPWDKGELEQDTILAGGDAYSRGDAVTPAPLSAPANLGGMPPAAFPVGQGDRRLALAAWITDPRNPLTARVVVNRVWSWHFGEGIAANPNNFGATGARPSHPELLDFLAAWFMEHGWSIKQLNALIVTSAAYQRSSRHPDPSALARLDPKRETCATFRPRRLAAEELRDAMLAASGELNPQIGGLPSRPDINLEVALQPRQIMGGTASVYEPDPTPAQRNRRSLYAEKIRGLRDPFMESFNQPGTDKSCERRESSTVAPQALTLFNAGEIHDRALAFAARLVHEGEGQPDATLIHDAFELALSRPPTRDELDACLAHWREAAQDERSLQPVAREFPARIERTVMAEKTGEPYTFWEDMPAYQHYLPDLQRHQADARTRGLAHLCLVLFNLNEFAYLD